MAGMNVRMNPQMRKAISSLLQNKLFCSNQIIMRRCLNTNCDMFFTQSTCYTITRRSNTRIPLYTTSWLYPINSTENFRPKCRTLKKNVPIDPLSKQPIMHEVKGDLVYAGQLTTNIRGAKGFAHFNSIVAICMQPFMIRIFHEVATLQTPIGVTMYALSMGTVIFGLPLGFHWLSRSYVMYLYFNEETKVFTATTIGFFLQNKDLVFKAEDVRFPASPSPFKHIEVKGKPIFIHPPSFRSQDVYAHMMGYDKPIELKFEHMKNSKK